jgi:hypothetical protein
LGCFEHNWLILTVDFWRIISSMNSKPHWRYLTLAVCSILPSICAGQNPRPAFTYALHALRERRNGFTLAPALGLPSTVFVLAPDDSLVVLIPQEDGEWVLKRVTDWSTSVPHEQTLSIVGERIGDQQISVTTDLAITPDAKDAIVRLTYREVAFGSVKPASPRAVIFFVDLRRFRITAKRQTSDALLAASQWRFTANGVLLANLFLSAVPAHLPDRPVSTSTYEAATLGFPQLHTIRSCDYNAGITCDTSEICRWEIGKQANSDCGDLLRNAEISSISEVLDNDDVTRRVTKLAGRDCRVSTMSDDRKLALFECRTGHSYLDGEIYITKSRTARVRTLPEGKPILTIALPHAHEIPGVLAAKNGTEYLVLLKDGIKLEGYRLPGGP